MHGLQTIHSQNETAARDARSVLLQRLTAEGKSYLIANDALGKPDIDAEVRSFPTAAQLKAHVNSTIAPTDIGNFTVVFGRD
jgi:hypothetical protein